MWKTLVCVCVCVCARITQNILLHQQETALERVAFSVLLGACAVQKLYTHTCNQKHYCKPHPHIIH